jgi:tRNA(Arg) A34 adenosine deaminase TadA
MTPAAPPSPVALHWARRLDPEGRGVAFALHPGQVLVAPSVMELVEGIWHAHPDQAHRLLRTRIHRTRPATDLDRAIVQLCSRKLCADVPTHLPGTPSERAVVDLTPAAAASRAHHVATSGLDVDAVPTDPAALAAHLARLVEDLAEPGPLATRARPVVALLIGRDDTLLDAARNTHGTHRLHHAEVNLVQRWQARRGPTLPAGCRVIVSLQCCRMCAALLADAAPPEGLDVVYATPETGRFGRDTVLQARRWERPLDTTTPRPGACAPAPDPSVR